MKNKWARIIAFAVLIGMMFFLQYPLTAILGDKPIPGTEKTYYGVVMQRAWKQVHDLTPGKGREAREYIGVKNAGIFHFSDSCESDVKEGDYVRIETAMEEDGFPIVTHIEILEQK